MKKKIVIAILCAAVSMGTIGCGNSTASAKTTQTDKKEDSKGENSEKSSEEKQSRDIFAMDTYMTVTLKFKAKKNGVMLVRKYKYWIYRDKDLDGIK